MWRGSADEAAKQHSLGWVLQEGSAEDDPRTLPNPNAPPPSAAECQMFRPLLERVKRFYAEGEEKQMHTREALTWALDLYQNAINRVDAQLEGLAHHPEDHPTRRRLEQQLREEKASVTEKVAELRVKQLDNERQFQKRRELTDTMIFLQDRMTKYCTRFEKEGSEAK
eukprot:TRINITY_DN7216_c0_g1_i1.p1 TRINITY_DN7216_c0_g1~~TRINITY_DN7216_c0_g1_i1.p1  ORF type:complete len:168 (-),score=35.73 TRINITY_DN7216_c0_g1_i1:186-689(-)